MVIPTFPMLSRHKQISLTFQKCKLHQTLALFFSKNVHALSLISITGTKSGIDFLNRWTKSAISR